MLRNFLPGGRFHYLMKALVFSLFTGLAVLSAASVHAADPPPVQTQTGDPSAQGGGKGGGGKGDRAAKMKAKFDELKTALNLTEDQQQKIKAIFDEQREAMKSLKDDTTLTKEQKMAKMNEGRQAVDTKIAAMLTPEQKTKWEELKKSHPKKGGAE